MTLVTYDSYRIRIPGAEYVRFLSLGRAFPPDRGKVARKIRIWRALGEVRRLAEGGELVFLSYDPWVMNRLRLDPRAVTVVEHNAVDRANDSALFRIAYRALPRRFRHLCFEPYIADFVRSTYGKNVTIRDHGIRSVQPNPRAVADYKARYGAFCFAPTPCREEGVVARFATLLEQEGLSLLTRASEGRSDELGRIHPNVHPLTGEVDFDSMLVAAEKIGVLNRYDYRVSGVFFDAIAAGKTCVLRDCRFARAAFERYSDASVQILSP